MQGMIQNLLQQTYNFFIGKFRNKKICQEKILDKPIVFMYDKQGLK